MNCVIGIGNEYRGDDGVGLAVIRELRGTVPASVRLLEREGEGTTLMAAMEEAETVYLVDATQSGAEPGTIQRFDLTYEALPLEGFVLRSTHAFGVAEAIALSRVLGRLPSRLILYGIEGADFAAGIALSPPVQEAARQAAERIRAELALILLGRNA